MGEEVSQRVEGTKVLVHKEACGEVINYKGKEGLVWRCSTPDRGVWMTRGPWVQRKNGRLVGNEVPEDTQWRDTDYVRNDIVRKGCGKKHVIDKASHVSAEIV